MSSGYRLLSDLNLIKKNYQGKSILVLGGLIIIPASVLIYFILYQIGYLDYELFSRFVFISLIIGTTGFLDDIAGDKKFQGLRGHFESLNKGILTTGIVKILVTVVTALLVVYEYDFSFFDKIINIGILILMTNLLNLLDLRPGRSIKIFILFSIFLWNSINIIINFLPFYFSIIFYLPYELKGNIMLGDSGSNLLGYILGFNLILSIKNINYKIIILFSIFILTFLSEKFSFTEIIKKNKILRWIDELGRTHY